MPVPSAISDLSQTAGSNYPAGSESPTTADDYLRTYASYIAKLRDGQGFTAPVTLASATTTDIGGQVSQFVDISGTTTITSFGTNYNGPRYIRFTGALTLTHNATSLILPTGANITTVAGDSCIAYPNAALNGWTVVAYAGKSGQFATISASGQITSTVSTGTAPMVIASTTKVTNLNADLLDGGDWAAPGAIGSTTPSTGAFTTLSATAGATFPIYGTGTGFQTNAAPIGVTSSVVGREMPMAYASDGTNTNLISSLGGSLAIFGTGVEWARFTSGNLGLGVTPSAWNTNQKVIQIGQAGSINSGTATSSAISIGENWYYNGSAQAIYIANNYATRYDQNLGTHTWYTAPSGTAGNAISFTQAMTLDASGRLVVGATSTAAKFQVTGASNNTYILIDNAGAGENYFHANVANIFGTAGSERARIDSSGNLLVGTASFNTTNGGFAFSPTSTAFVSTGHGNGTAPGSEYANYAYNGVIIGSITQNGTTAVSYNTTSDHRLKENVRPADAARFMDIEFVDFEWVDGRHDCGVIAHQLQSVYPDLVLGEKDSTEVRTVEITPAVPEVKDEEGNIITPAIPAVTEEQTFPVYQQVNYIGLIGRMGTRIQALQRTVDAQAAMLAAMEVRLAALEAA